MSTKNNINVQTKDEQRKSVGGDCSLHSYNKVQVKANVSMHKL